MVAIAQDVKQKTEELDLAVSNLRTKKSKENIIDACDAFLAAHYAMQEYVRSYKKTYNLQ